jgi:hypothetical protein
MTRTKSFTALLTAPLMVFGFAALSACATGDTAARADPFELVEQNASISNRHMVRRISVLDDDMLLAEVGAGQYYRIRLGPGCVDFADVFANVRLAETGSGIDRSSRFIVDGQTCMVRSIDEVRRVRPNEAEAGAETASLEAEASAETPVAEPAASN